jgi:di/tricarboxylate transporter
MHMDLLANAQVTPTAITHQMLIVFGVLAGAVGLFGWGRLRADIVAILVVVALMLSRVLTPQESLAGFGNPVVILIAAIFVVGEGVVNTGIAHRLGEAVMKAGRGHEIRLIVLIMLLAGGVGAFMSSTATVALLIPVVLAIADKSGLNRKRLLMPLSIATLISGMMTLIASSPNMIVENALRAGHFAPLGFFSFTPFGLAVLAVSIVYMVLGRGLLSKRPTAEEAGATAPSAADLIASYGLLDRWHRLRLAAGSPLINKSMLQLRQLHDRFGLILVGIEKQRHGKPVYLPALPDTTFEPDDVIYALVDPEEKQLFLETQQLIEVPRLDERQRSAALQELGVAELMLAPESKLIGKTLAALEFRARYQVAVLAMRRRGRPLTAKLTAQPLDFGDALLVGGDWGNISRLWQDRENFVVLTLPSEYQERLPARRRAPIAVGILVAMVAVMAFGLVPNAAAALLAALAMIATGCVALESIYRVISWKSLVVIAGMLPLATALTKTGATVLMANGLVTALGALGPVAMLAVVFLVTAVVGFFISNSATAVLIAPVAIQAAQTLHVSPRAFAMTVAIACGAAFVTPVSSPVNMLVMEPAGYSFGDFVKVGLPMMILTMILTVALVTVIYPL